MATGRRSHTAVYKHFSSKQALREGVTRRWLSRDRDTLAAIACDTQSPPPRRLRAWLAAKKAKARDDPELFAAYGILAAEHSSAAAEHVADLLRQLQAIIADGTADGSFAPVDPAVAAHAVFDATTLFHHPAHAAEWQARASKPGSTPFAPCYSTAWRLRRCFARGRLR